MNPITFLRSRLARLYAAESYVVRLQAGTLFYLTLFLCLALPLLAVAYGIFLPLRAAVAVPPLLVIAGVSAVSFAFLMVGWFRWAGPILAYVIAAILLAAQIPKLEGEYYTFFAGFVHVYLLPIVTAALFARRSAILPLAAVMLIFNTATFLYIVPRVEVVAQLTAVQIGWAASSVNLVLSTGILYLLRRLFDLALERMNETNRSISRFVPEESLALLQKSGIEEVSLGENRELEMTVLFADIRDFTAASESMDALKTFTFVNRYLEAMGPLIRSREGFIDKYIGDGILALFQDPTHGLEAAVAMLEALPALNRKNAVEGFPPIELGIGLHHGPVRIGIIGEAGRVENTVIGDVVNTASRLESLNKELGTRLLVSRTVLERVKPLSRASARLVDLCRLRGKARAIQVYEVFTNDAQPIREKKKALAADYTAALKAFLKGEHDQAQALLEAYLPKFPSDRPALHLLDRCLQSGRARTRGSLFAKYGKMNGIFAVVSLFYQNMLSDPDLKGFFEGVDVERLKGHQTKVVAHLMGAPLSFDPAHLKVVHSRLGITGAHFDAALGHLYRSLLQAGVESEDAKTIVSKFGAFREDIVVH